MRNKAQVIQQLKEIRQMATMKDSSFRVGGEPFPADITDLVRQATRLWRESWILGPLDELIKELEVPE